VLLNKYQHLLSITTTDNMKALLLAASGVINQLVLIVAGLALIYFFLGLVKFIFNSAVQKAKKREKIL